MALCHLMVVMLLIGVIISGPRLSADALAMEYYAISCPIAEVIVKNTVNQALRKDPTLSAGLLRMHFHDCFVQGCDGSVLIDTTKDNTAEKDSPANLSLRGYEIIDQAKEEIETQCPGVVSCADILAMAARDAVLWVGCWNSYTRKLVILPQGTPFKVFQRITPDDVNWREVDNLINKMDHDLWCEGVAQENAEFLSYHRYTKSTAGGPVYDIPKGRKDGRRSKIEDTINLPSPTLNSSGLIRTFRQHGFTVQETVVLSGGHTLGVAQCSSFKNRLRNFDSTNDVDPSLDSAFAKTLTKTCNVGGDSAKVPFDQTRTTFDNTYFYALQARQGLLSSDQTLFTSTQTRGLVNAYAMNQARFFFDFSQATVKMGLLDVKEGNQGEVREDCRRVN